MDKSVSYKDFVLRILNSAKGDNFERASRQFMGRSVADMQKEYGESGHTCQEILDGYRKEREEFLAAVEWVKGLR